MVGSIEFVPTELVEGLDFYGLGHRGFRYQKFLQIHSTDAKVKTIESVYEKFPQIEVNLML